MVKFIFNTKNQFFFWVTGYALIVFGACLPEAQWQLGGEVFSTTLATQWTGYLLLSACLLAVVWQSLHWRRRKLVSFWASLLCGGYAAGFALFKWFRFGALSHDFQAIDAQTSMAVRSGAGLVLVFCGGLILLVLAVGRLRRLPEP